MICYRTLNEYLDTIELPKSIEEVLSHQYKLEDKELDFVSSANRVMREYADYESYREQNAHCMGTCLTNLTRIGIYFLLENEIVTVSTSNLKAFNGQAEWQITHYPFRKIQELDFQLMEGSDGSNYEAGILYIKVLNARDQERTHILRNLNPNHFQCFKDFHRNIRMNLNISNPHN